MGAAITFEVAENDKLMFHHAIYEAPTFAVIVAVTCGGVVRDGGQVVADPGGVVVVRSVEVAATLEKALKKAHSELAMKAEARHTKQRAWTINLIR